MDTILLWLTNWPYALIVLGVLFLGIPFLVCYLIASINFGANAPRWSWIVLPAFAAGCWSLFCLLWAWAVLTDPDNVTYGMNGTERALGAMLIGVLGDGVLAFRGYRLRKRRQARVRAGVAA